MTNPAPSKTGQYRFENTIGVQTGAMVMRGQWGGNKAGGQKQEDETRTSIGLRVTMRYDDIEELPWLEEQAKTMMTHMNRIGKAVSDQVDVILEQTCEPLDGDQVPAAPPMPEPKPDPITKGQLEYIMDMVAGRTKKGPITPSDVRENIVERRATVAGEHLRKATEAHGEQVQDFDQLHQNEASALIDDLKAIKPPWK